MNTYSCILCAVVPDVQAFTHAPNKDRHITILKQRFESCYKLDGGLVGVNLSTTLCTITLRKNNLKTTILNATVSNLLKVGLIRAFYLKNCR